MKFNEFSCTPELLKTLLAKAEGTEPDFDVTVQMSAHELYHLARAAQCALDSLLHPIAPVFAEALQQVTQGKGIERHGVDQDGVLVEFLAQDWYAIAVAHGPGFLTGQAEKKLRESNRLTGPARRKERLGSINYTAMAILFEDIHGEPRSLAQENFIHASLIERIGILEGKVYLARESLATIAMERFSGDAKAIVQQMQREAEIALESVAGFDATQAAGVRKDALAEEVIVAAAQGRKPCSHVWPRFEPNPDDKCLQCGLPFRQSADAVAS